MDRNTGMSSDEYRIRPYEPRDRDGFLSLYESVWGAAKGPEWFDWRFGSNPYRDGVQMIVAEQDGQLIGADPILPFRLRIGSRTVDAYQPVDMMVHPDHRRRGVFSGMTEQLLEQYNNDAALLFNFPTDALLPGLKKFDWREIGSVPTSYRVQNPSSILSDHIGSTTSNALSPFLRVAEIITKRGLAALDRLNAPLENATIETYDGVVAAPIERLYNSAPPERIHVPRDVDFLEWRFGNPRWETSTCVASRDGDPVASIVAATEHNDGHTTTMLLDAQPASNDQPAAEAVEMLLVRMLRDNIDADLVKVPGWFRASLRHRYGFWNDTATLLTSLVSVSKAVIRPLRTDGDLDSTESWHIDGVSLTDEDNWLFTLSDQDLE